MSDGKLTLGNKHVIIRLMIFILLLGTMVGAPAWSQSAEDELGSSSSSASDSTPSAESNNSPDALQEGEELYDREAQPKKAKVAEPKEEKKMPAVKNLSDLARLSEFSDVAVIQKRFLPKTGRFELSLSGLTNLNNPFFTNFGAGARIGYYFREKYGVELLFDFLTTGERQVTKDLQKDRGIDTDNLVTSEGFIGAAFKWNPIYGKMTWLNRHIVPFDLNFSVGGGLTKTNEGGNEPTLHLSTSQVFALSKMSAVRWDVTWNMFQANTTNARGEKDKLFQSDILIGLGMSFYFPEATYR